MLKTWVWSLIWEDPTRLRATKPMCHNPWAGALKPGSCSYWSPRVPVPRLCNKRNHCSKPTHCTSRAAPTRSSQRKACAAMKTQHNQKQIKIYKKNMMDYAKIKLLELMFTKVVRLTSRYKYMLEFWAGLSRERLKTEFYKMIPFTTISKIQQAYG